MTDRHDGRGPTRRDVAVGAAAGTLALSMSGARPRRTPRAAFVSHGAPSLALDRRRGHDLAAWGEGFDAPDAIVVVSAHWERTPVTIGTSRPRPLYHDYGGFAPELRDVTYDAPVAADLARVIERGLADGTELGAVERDDDRPWDHGVWVPLVHLAPRRDVPVIQVSLASETEPETLVRLGERLRAVVGDRVLVLGSGGMVHNLGALDWSERSGPPAWAVDFETWARRALDDGDRDALVDFADRAPALRRAHPTLEHWLPLLVVLGAGAVGAGAGAPRYPVEGFEYGSLSRLAVEFS